MDSGSSTPREGAEYHLRQDHPPPRFLGLPVHLEAPRFPRPHLVVLMALHGDLACDLLPQSCLTDVLNNYSNRPIHNCYQRLSFNHGRVRVDNLNRASGRPPEPSLAQRLHEGRVGSSVEYGADTPWLPWHTWKVLPCDKVMHRALRHGLAGGRELHAVEYKCRAHQEPRLRIDENGEEGRAPHLYAVARHGPHGDVHRAYLSAWPAL
mmetsp:Transcript_69332/g.219381  ORF Transcript_69332/g.219381 Transcript_69332/m.219381 type:complete len:208 (+) Transcript_69332:267-890(+)